MSKAFNPVKYAEKILICFEYIKVCQDVGICEISPDMFQ